MGTRSVDLDVVGLPAGHRGNIFCAYSRSPRVRRTLSGFHHACTLLLLLLLCVSERTVHKWWYVHGPTVICTRICTLPFVSKFRFHQSPIFNLQIINDFFCNFSSMLSLPPFESSKHAWRVRVGPFHLNLINYLINRGGRLHIQHQPTTPLIRYGYY
jgi:hypothetical protein